MFFIGFYLFRSKRITVKLQFPLFFLMNNISFVADMATKRVLADKDFNRIIVRTHRFGT